MVSCAWVLSGILILIIILLFIKLILLRKSVMEICSSLSDKLTTETNTLIDISSRDRYMRELAESLNEQLRQLRTYRHRFQQGDAELKDAVTNISHDLRTPLTAICGYLELLEREEQRDSVKHYLAMIANRTETLKQLTEELFRYSILACVNDDTRENIVLNYILEETLVSYYGAMKQKHITPKIYITDHLVVRSLNRSALIRTFENIISNALKYSDGDFTVKLTAEGEIIFSNTAYNLTPVMAGQLFERFYTVETARNSTGLGLSIAKLLTERMGGTIVSDYYADTLYITLHFPLS